jgi:hypothetical protein
MAIAPGGFVNQTIDKDPIPAADWAKDNTIMFNLTLMSASAIYQVTGVKPPVTPVTPSVYAQYGYPFFKLYEEPSGISGDFNGT